MAGLTLAVGGPTCILSNGLAITMFCRHDVSTSGAAANGSATENQDLFCGGVRVASVFGSRTSPSNSLFTKLARYGSAPCSPIQAATPKSAVLLHFLREFRCTSPDDCYAVRILRLLLLPDGTPVFVHRRFATWAIAEAKVCECWCVWTAGKVATSS